MLRRTFMRPARIVLVATLFATASCDAVTDPPDDPGFFLYVGGSVSRPEESRGALLRWNGTTWEDVAVPVPVVSSIRGGGPDDLVLAGNRAVLHFDGNIFTSLLDADIAGDWGILEGIWPAGPGPDAAMFAVGYGRTAIRRTGSSWSLMEPFRSDPDGPPNYSLFGIWGFGPEDLFAVGGSFAPDSDESRIWRYVGSQWSLMDAPLTAERLWDVWGSSPDDVFAVGFHGTILHYDGEAWERMESAYDGTIYGVHGSGPDDVFAVGNEGTILHYDGETWTVMDSGRTEPISAVWVRSPGEAYAVELGGGAVLRYDGSGWSTIRDAEEGLYLHAVWAAD